MRRMRDGEAERAESARRDFHSGFWLAVSVQHYNLRFLQIPREMGRQERCIHTPSKGKEGKRKASVINALTTKSLFKVGDLGGAWHTYNDSATVQRETALLISCGPPVQSAVCPTGACTLSLECSLFLSHRKNSHLCMLDQKAAAEPLVKCQVPNRSKMFQFVQELEQELATEMHE